jgi:hypothetical protein
VFWSPANDDYDFRNRQLTSATLEFNERRFCWAELDVTNAAVVGTSIHLFPYICPEGLYTFALIVEYGQYKSFDFVGIEVPKRIPSSVSEFDAIQQVGVQWSSRRGPKGLWRTWRIRNSVANTDYHNYVRPT